MKLVCILLSAFLIAIPEAKDIDMEASKCKVEADPINVGQVKITAAADLSTKTNPIEQTTFTFKYQLYKKVTIGGQMYLMAVQPMGGADPNKDTKLGAGDTYDDKTVSWNPTGHNLNSGDQVRVVFICESGNVYDNYTGDFTWP